ncbi:MAG: DNA-3-methyladenine glycosylase I [Methylococcales bacterium]
MKQTKCAWALSSSLEEQYHDQEWGVPIHDDRLLFEFLTLEGAQAGLSWSTILKRRDAYRIAFDNFDPTLIAQYDHNKVSSLLENTGIIRNRLKIHSVITNAQAFLAIQAEFGSFDHYIWSFVKGQTVHNAWLHASEVPAFSDVSLKMSQALKKRGFKFVGSVICYAYMQAIGMMNDHTVDCFRYAKINTL